MLEWILMISIPTVAILHIWVLGNLFNRQVNQEEAILNLRTQHLNTRKEFLILQDDIEKLQNRLQSLQKVFTHLTEAGEMKNYIIRE